VARHLVLRHVQAEGTSVFYTGLSKHFRILHSHFSWATLVVDLTGNLQVLRGVELFDVMGAVPLFTTKEKQKRQCISK
jgi:hypothetical protein